MSRALEYCREMIRSFFSQNGCWWLFWMSEIHFRLHFSPFEIKTQLSFFFAQNGCRQPFWMSEINFCLHFWPFQIKMQLSFFFTKWPPAAILDVRNSFSFAFLVNSDENATVIFFHKMAAGGHFGFPKFIFV